MGLDGKDQVIEHPLLQPGMLHGSVLPGYRVDLVYVHDLVKASTPGLEYIQEEVAGARMLTELDERIALFIDDLILRYEVVEGDRLAAMAAPLPGAVE